VLQLCSGAASAVETQMGKQLPRVQSDSGVKTVGHLNGSTVRPLSKPNMPSTITELGGQKTAANVCQKSESPVALTKSGVRPLNSAEDTTTMNGHPVGHLSQSSPALKSKIPNSCEVPSASDTCNISFSKKQPESDDRDCYVKQNKHSDKESRCSTVTHDSFVAKTPSHHKVHVQSGGESSEYVKHSPSKWNCCVNIHKKDRVKTSSNGDQIDDKACVVGSTSHCKSVDITERMRKNHKKLSKTKTVSDSSTTNWHVMKCSDGGVSQSLHDKVHGTTSWHVTDDAASSSVMPVSSGDSSSAVQQSDNMSAACNQAVRGGQQRMVNGDSVLHEETRKVHRTSAGQTGSCMYRCMLLMILLLKNFQRIHCH